jgi:hypothetical protein
VTVFATRQEFIYPLPELLREPGAQYWRFVTTTTNTVTYCLKVLLRDSEGQHFLSMLLTSDEEVVDIIERDDVEAVLALVGVLPYLGDDPVDSVRCFSATEIWLGTTAAAAAQTPLFVDEQGKTRAGLFGEVQADTVVRQRLVAKVGLLEGSSLK